MKQGKRKMATMAIVATLLATGATAQTYTHHYPKAVERAAAKWVKQGQWRGAFNKAVPAPTVNLTEFCIQYSRNPKLWDELFQWLQNNDLKALKPGRTPIGKTGLVASVEDGTNWCSEHDLRNGKGSESHRDNIDFMIVVDGVEHYRYDATRLKRFEMAPNTFCIMFPCDWHIAKIKTGKQQEHVKVIVVKMPYER